jgi:hypothetical protein
LNGVYEQTAYVFMDNIILKNYLELSLLKTVREGIDEGDGDGGEGKFGLVPFSVNPNNALLKAVSQTGKQRVNGPRPHPLLSKSPQFSGVDRHLTVRRKLRVRGRLV